MTSQEQVQSIKNLCESIIDPVLIQDAWINDYGRHGNFDIFVLAHQRDRHTTTKIKAAIRAKLPRGCHIREVFSPQPVKEWYPGWGRRGKYKTVKYDRNHWSIDIDFQRYDPNTNTFAQ